MLSVRISFSFSLQLVIIYLFSFLNIDLFYFSTFIYCVSILKTHIPLPPILGETWRGLAQYRSRGCCWAVQHVSDESCPVLLPVSRLVRLIFRVKIRVTRLGNIWSRIPLFHLPVWVDYNCSLASSEQVFSFFFLLKLYILHIMWRTMLFNEACFVGDTCCV